MDPQALDGELLALLFIRCDEDGNALEDGHLIRTGRCHWDGEHLWLDWGENHPDPPYNLDLANLERVRPTTASIMPYAQAPFILSFEMTPLSDEDKASGDYNLLWRNPNSPGPG